MKLKLDCILIPGGGLLPDGTLPPWTVSRLNRALELADKTAWIGLLSGGTVHKPPPLNREGFPLHESRQAAAFLTRSGIKSAKLLTEISSYDTIGNAYFSRLLFAEPFALERLLVITSAFHMPRTEAIFRWVYSLAPVPVNFQLSFESVSDLGLSGQALTARQSREAESLRKVQEKFRDITTLELIHHWLYTKHAAYAVNQEIETISKDELRTY